MTFLSLSNALAVWAAYALVDQSRWVSLTILVAVTRGHRPRLPRAAPRTLPLKFLVPGTVFLLAFQIVPIVYTIEVALSNYSTGHIISKADAIRQIKINSLRAAGERQAVRAGTARDKAGKLVLILRDDTSGRRVRRHHDALKPLPEARAKVDRHGDPDRGDRLHADQRRRAVLARQAAGGARTSRRPATPRSGRRASTQRGRAPSDAPVLRRARPFVRITRRRRLQRQRQGLLRRRHHEELEPGWKAFIGFSQLPQARHEPPLPRSVHPRLHLDVRLRDVHRFLSFALACSSRSRSTRRAALPEVYRSVLMIPYAMPGFLSLLVWGGLLNDDFGVVNKLFALWIVPWLFDANWARVSVVLVSVWLTTPYFFLVSLGALQSIPAELTEAARVDGGGALGGLPARDAATAPRRGRAADDRVVRVQLQQLQQHLPADRRRAIQRLRLRSRAPPTS